jgi:hypothetical protein
MLDKWHRKPLYAGLILALVVVALGLWLWLSPQGVTSAELSQQQVEATALAQAKAGLGYTHLEGTPTTVAVRRVTYKQANATLEMGTTDCTADWNAPVWVVVFSGRTVSYGPSMANGPQPALVRDDGYMFVVLDTAGEEFASGTRDATPLNFDAPVPPTPTHCSPGPAVKEGPGPTSTPAPTSTPVPSN